MTTGLQYDKVAFIKNDNNTKERKKESKKEKKMRSVYKKKERNKEIKKERKKERKKEEICKIRITFPVHPRDFVLKKFNIFICLLSRHQQI